MVPPAEVGRLRPLLLDALYREVVALGGSISAEHGIGRAKRDAFVGLKSPLELDLMRRLKRIFDPSNILNPDIVLPGGGLEALPGWSRDGG